MQSTDSEPATIYKAVTGLWKVYVSNHLTLGIIAKTLPSRPTLYITMADGHLKKGNKLLCRAAKTARYSLYFWKQRMIWSVMNMHHLYWRWYFCIKTGRWELNIFRLDKNGKLLNRTAFTVKKIYNYLVTVVLLWLSILEKREWLVWYTLVWQIDPVFFKNL